MTVKKEKPDLKRFDELVAEIKSKTQEQKALTTEKRQTPVWNLLRRNDLTKRIAQLTEELEELRSEKTQILAQFDYTEDKDIQQVRAWVGMKEKNIDDLRSKETQCEQDFDVAQTEFDALSSKAKDHDLNALWPHRLNFRKELEHETTQKLQIHFGNSFSLGRLRSAENDVRLCLDEDERSMKRYVKQREKAELGQKVGINRKGRSER